MKKPSSEKKEPVSSLKGMNDILGDVYFEYQGFFEKASDVALYYGFKPIETPILEKESLFMRGIHEGTDIVDKEMYGLKTKGGDHLAMRPEGTASIMRAYLEHGMQSEPQPVMLYYYGPYFRHDNPQHGRLREFRQFGVECLGTEKSIADALVIKTLLVILEEAGFKDITVRVNSIGDKTCRPTFLRELINYYKKHIDDICANCKNRLKTNPMRLLDCKDKRCRTIKDEAPETFTYLCTACRSHFKEVLEYLEALGVSYQIDTHLVRGLDYYTRTAFEIFPTETPEEEAPEESNEEKKKGVASDNTSEKSTLAIGGGGRFDDLAKALGSKKDVPSVGGSIGVDRVLLSEHHKHLRPRVVKKPKVYFIQLGFEAKLKSLTVIDILRKAKVPIMQALSKDGLSSQLGHAESLDIPYTIIFGQKEALEDSVIVRDMSTRSQDTVKIASLGDYLKNLK